jgi:predicted CoA-binding protein
MLAGRRIAVVGLSTDPYRPSHDVARYLERAGYEIIPVNPLHDEVMGHKCYPRLQDVPGPIDVVDVFRRAQFCADVARDAVEAGAKGLWLQSGIVSDEAREIARRAGLDYVEDRCLKVDHMMRER